MDILLLILIITGLLVLSNLLIKSIYRKEHESISLEQELNLEILRTELKIVQSKLRVYEEIELHILKKATKSPLPKSQYKTRPTSVGFHHTEETKRKISKKQKAYWNEIRKLQQK